MLKRVFIQRDAEPPALVPGEGKLAKAYTFLRSVQFNSGKPFSVVNLHLDQELFFRDSKRFTRSAALPKIVEMEDVVITHAYQTFTIGVADPETADLLEIGLGEPTADCHLTVIDDKGVAIYVADIHYLKNCFVFATTCSSTAGRTTIAGRRPRSFALRSWMRRPSPRRISCQTARRHRRRFATPRIDAPWRGREGKNLFKTRSDLR